MFLALLIREQTILFRQKYSEGDVQQQNYGDGSCFFMTELSNNEIAYTFIITAGM